MLRHTLLCNCSIYSSIDGFWRFVGQASANEGTCRCVFLDVFLDGENLVGSRKDPVFVTYSF